MRRHELPAELRGIGRNKLETFAQQLLDRGNLVLCMAKGGTTKKWMDVPGGNFALGLGEFAMGAAEKG